MPGAGRRTQQRLPRCTYQEGNRQCHFSGDGDPAFCRAHRLIVAEQTQARPIGKAAFDLFQQFMQGRRITEDDVRRTLEDEAWAFGGHIAQGYQPHVDGAGREQDPVDWSPEEQQSRPGPPPGWRSRWTRSAPPPPVDEDAQRKIAARGVLGFPPNETLTEDKVRARVRELAKRYHPDRAGTDEKLRKDLTKKMQIVTEAANALMENM